MEKKAHFEHPNARGTEVLSTFEYCEGNLLSLFFKSSLDTLRGKMLQNLMINHPFSEKKRYISNYSRYCPWNTRPTKKFWFNNA